MGMFDDIDVDYPLPGLPNGHDRKFQTKSLGCVLATYSVDEHGGLWQGGEAVRYSGEIEFHDFDPDHGYLSYRAWFRDGRLLDLLPVSA